MSEKNENANSGFEAIVNGIPPQDRFDCLKLENQLCFPLYAASRQVVGAYRPLLDRLGLTYTQYVTLMVLWEHDSVSVKELGTRLYLDSGTLTPVLKSLEGKGLINRQRSHEDERMLVVTLTDEGVALKEQAAAVPEKIACCMKIEPEEAAFLYKILYKILGENV